MAAENIVYVHDQSPPLCHSSRGFFMPFVPLPLLVAILLIALFTLVVRRDDVRPARPHLSSYRPRSAHTDLPRSASDLMEIAQALAMP